VNSGEILGDRWRILAELPGDRSVQRWRGESLEDGSMVEIMVLREGVANEARHRFASVHRDLKRVREPGLVQIHAVFDDGPPTVVRAATEETSLGDIRGPLPPEVVGAIAGRLIPAVLAAGGATAGALNDLDVVLDSTGSPILAPRAVPPTRVARSLTRNVAPEAFQGRPPDGASGLYGLGAILYRLATGRSAFAGNKAGPQKLPVPPSTVYPGVPEWLDGAILTLLSSEPALRAGALPDFLDNAGEIGDLREHTAPLTGDVKISRSTALTRRGHLDRAPVASVVLPASALGDLDPAARSVIAGVSGLPITVVDELAAAGLPVVIEQLGNRSNAADRAAKLQAESGLPIVSSAATAWAPWMFAAAAGATSTVPLGLGAILVATGFAVVGVPILAVGIAIAGTGAFAARRATQQSDLYRASERAAEAAREAMAQRGDAILDATWARLARLRQQLGRADLPETVSTDLRGSLKDIERRIEGISHVLDTANRALDQVDLDRARTRLAALDARTGDDPERDRLARTVADLEEVESRRVALLAERDRIDAALDEFAGVLGQLASGDAGVEEAGEQLEALNRTARLAQAAKAETE